MVKKINKFCLICNIPFNVLPSGKHRKYCGRECTNKGRFGKHLSQATKEKLSQSMLGKFTGKNHPNWKPKIHKSCLICGEPFDVVPSGKNRKYCSLNCSSKSRIKPEIYKREKKLKSQKQYRIKNRDKLREKDRQRYKENKEKMSQKKKKYYTENRERLLEYAKQYYKDNKDSRQDYGKEYYIHNKDKIDQWRKENINKIRFTKNKNNRRHRKIDPQYRLDENIRREIRRSIKSGKNGHHWEECVGYTLEQLIRHLKRQFQKGMTWDNYGDWHIEHIIPRSAFNFTKVEYIDFKRCWALSNLRPLWASDNLKKGNKITIPFQLYLPIEVLEKKPQN